MSSPGGTNVSPGVDKRSPFLLGTTRVVPRRYKKHLQAWKERTIDEGRLPLVFLVLVGRLPLVAVPRFEEISLKFSTKRLLK